MADNRPALKAAGWAVAILALIGTVAALEPTQSGIAFRRLLRPYGPDRWPQATHLTVLPETPKKIARGMPFALAAPATYLVGQRPDDEGHASVEAFIRGDVER